MENKIEEARARKRSGEYNCAQAVACTFSDVTGLDEETLRAATNAFGAGMATMEGTCGALTGAAVVVGLATRDRARSRALIKEIMTGFRMRNGATVCRELKGVGTGRVLRQCEDCVADAAEFLEKALDKEA